MQVKKYLELLLVWNAESRRFGICFLLNLTVLLGVGFILGVFSAEFLGADEASHVVTGIMVEQYLTRGVWEGKGAMEFASDYYAHYPYFAIGHWPPVFYFFEAVWIAVAGLSRSSIVIFALVIAALPGLFCSWLCRREGLGWGLAGCAGVVVSCLPQSLISTIEISSDPMTAVAILVGTVLCDRWLNDLSLKWGAAFGLSAAAAVMVKGNAFVLGLVPGLWILFTGQYRKVLEAKFWAPLLCVLLIAAPWYLFAWEYVQGEIVPGHTTNLWARRFWSARSNGLGITAIAGYGIFLIAIAGTWKGWMQRMPAMAVLPLACWLFLSFLSPHTEARLMLAVIPVFCFSAAVAMKDFRLLKSVGILAVCLLSAYWISPVPAKTQLGFVAAGEWLTAKIGVAGAKVLVSSNGGGEGALISEMAMRTPKPGIMVLRANKLLQSTTWMGGDLKLLASERSEVAKLLELSGVDWVVLHMRPEMEAAPHQKLLIAVLQDWNLVSVNGEVKIYQRRVLK